MNKKALGLSALGFLVFTAPAFAQSTKTETKEELDVGKKGSSYKAEKTTKSGDAIKSTTDQEKVEKSTKKNAKGGTTTEVTRKSKHPAGSATGGSGDSKTHTTKEKTETDSSGNVVKEKKTKD